MTERETHQQPAPATGEEGTGPAPGDGHGPGLNRLAGEKSPYLLQHAANPVDWYPWGEEAFERARREEKPILLSVGYSTCHWCHVMERESFEDPEVADLMNDAFVSIKVDREERPDIDGVYMTVCQMMTGGGGWPLTVVMTPDKKPFFAGTYFPKRGRGGRIGMMELVPRLRRLWEERRDDVERSADGVMRALERTAGGDGGVGAGGGAAGGAAGAADDRGAGALDAEVPRKAYEQLAAVYDELQGGFGGAPKFPTPHNLLFLLRWWKRTGEEHALEMVEHTLRSMRRGGIFDHVGFGFHRYSTDARWLLPHFEKMLYDQALLVLAYTETFLATGDPRYERTAREVLAYVLRDMRDPAGAFYSAEDADSEGREGKFYLWTEEELREVLGEQDALLVKGVYNVERRGNFAEEATGERTGENILHLRKPLSMLAGDLGTDAESLRERLEGARRRLFEARERRVRPLRDDKILTDWNGLMIAALAVAGRSFGESAFITAAEEAADFLFGALRDGEGRLLHRYRDGEAAIRATADDYAFLIRGLIELYQANFAPRHLRDAARLMDEFLARFWDEEGGGFFVTPDDAEDLPVRRKEIYDGATPSANSVAYLDLLRLARLTGRPGLEERAARLESTFATAVARAPSAETMFLVGLDFRLGPGYEVVIVGEPGAEDTRRLLGSLRREFLPNAVVLLKPGGEGEPEITRIAEFTRDHVALDGEAAAYVCRDYACRRPTTSPEEMVASLAS